MFTTAQEYILDIPKFTTKNSLDHTRTLLEKLGNPQNGLQVIHVGGTNGKGSVCAMMQAILQRAGNRTGMFTSPHLISMTERIAVDGQPVTKQLFVKAYEKVRQVSVTMQEEGLGHPTFFEFLFAMAMLIFTWEKVDYAIVEVGLGGRLDCTNVLEQPICTILTNVSLEHTEILGNTIEEIATEKAGIIKKGTPLCFFDKDSRVSEIWRNRARELEADYYSISMDSIKNIKFTEKKIDFSVQSRYYCYDGFVLPFVGLYQIENGALAALAAWKLGIAPDLIKNGLVQTKWQGRMQSFGEGIYLDGAHNAQGIEMFVQTVGEISSDIKGERQLLFSAVCEKDYEAMIENLCSQIQWDVIYITQIDNSRRLMAEKIEACFKKCTDARLVVLEDVKQCFQYAKVHKRQQDMLFCAGSLYLMGTILECMKDAIG